MTPFYSLIYILAYSELYTVAQKLSHRYVYLSTVFYNCSYKKLSKHRTVTISNSQLWLFLCRTHFNSRSLQALNSSTRIVKYLHYFKCLQDGQHTYNVTLRHIHATTAEWEKQKYYIFWVYVCCLRYLACNDHASNGYMAPVKLHNIVPHYLVNGTILSKISYWTQNVCFQFSPTFVWNISHSRKNQTRYDKKSDWSSCKVPVLLVRV